MDLWMYSGQISFMMMLTMMLTMMWANYCEMSSMANGGQINNGLTQIHKIHHDLYLGELITYGTT
jgi:hypothetical protein